MEEAFEDLQGWFLPSQQEATAETAALAQGAARLEEAACLGGPDQSLLPVGWPLPACCAPKRRRRTEHGSGGDLGLRRRLLRAVVRHKGGIDND